MESRFRSGTLFAAVHVVLREDGAMAKAGNDMAPAEKGPVGKQSKDKKRLDAPIPRPTTDLGFHGVRRKRVEFDSRTRWRRSESASV